MHRRCPRRLERGHGYPCLSGGLLSLGRCRPGPAEAIKTAATGWAAFWDGHLDLDALAVDVTEHLSDLTDDRCARW